MKKKGNNKVADSKIVINRMFSGGYLTQNLGHEVINMFESDGDGYFLYLNPLGSFDKKHAGKIKKMVLVRTTSYKGCVEVIGLADGLTDIPADATSQERLIKSVSYGGVTLEQLFDGNEAKQKCFITFKASNVWSPTTPTYLVFKDGTNELDNNNSLRVVHLDSNQAKSNLFQYISSVEETADYQRIEELFSQDEGTPMPKVNIEKLKCPTEKTFFEACGIDNSELAFSNMFAYILEKYPDVLQGLTSKCGTKIDCSTLSVKRETEANIDLFVETPSHILVIENKVLSDINGKKKGKESDESQLKDYCKHVEENYESDPREKLFILLTPDHNNIDLSKYECGDKYTKVFYSEVRDVLVAYSERHHLQSDLYLQELIKAMHKHSQKFYSELFEQTERRLYQRLRSKS